MDNTTESEIWIYPLKYGQTLARADWIPFYFDRLLNSTFSARVDPASGFYAVQLWAAACRQDPAGTLPDDPAQLAKLCGLGRDLAAWAAVERGALYGWRPVVIEADDGGETFQRLGHPVLAGACAEAHARLDATRRAAAEGGRRKALSRVRAAAERSGLPARFLAQPGTIEAIADRLDAAGQRVTPEAVRAAGEAHQIALDAWGGFGNVTSLRS